MPTWLKEWLFNFFLSKQKTKDSATCMYTTVHVRPIPFLFLQVTPVFELTADYQHSEGWPLDHLFQNQLLSCNDEPLYQHGSPGL